MASPAPRTRRQAASARTKGEVVGGGNPAPATGAGRAAKAEQQNGGRPPHVEAANGAQADRITVATAAGKQPSPRPRIKRIHRIAAAGALLLAAWLAMLSRAPPPARPAVALLPVLAAAAFGVVLLARLVQGVLTFRTCPEAEAELRKDIERARKLLAARGFRLEEGGGDGGGGGGAAPEAGTPTARRRGGGAGAGGGAAGGGAVSPTKRSGGGARKRKP